MTEARTGDSPVMRPLGPGDAEAVLAIFVACDIAEIGEADTDLSDVLSNMDLPGAQWYGVDAPSGGLAGLGFAATYPSHSHAEVEVRISPDGDPALGPALLDVARGAADRLTPGRPVHCWVHVDDAVRRGWFEGVGGRTVRHFWRMVVDFDGSPPIPPQPAGDERITVVGDDDALHRQVFDVVDTAFQDHFGHDPDGDSSFDDFVRRARTSSGYDPTLWWLASVDGVPAAALIGRALPEYALINTLGTLREFRGRGLGRTLLQTAFAEMYSRGYRRASLGVDAANPTGAVRLYESVGMRAEHTWAVYELPPFAVTS